MKIIGPPSRHFGPVLIIIAALNWMTNESIVRWDNRVSEEAINIRIEAMVRAQDRLLENAWQEMLDQVRKKYEASKETLKRLEAEMETEKL